ncbi:MAG: glycosyltransferase family 2 protein [bacterium]
MKSISVSTPSPFKIIILSARASNLVICVQSVLEKEPSLPADHIIVVDDGARSEAESKLPGIQWLTGIKPFIYARNANLGIREAGTDVVLLNDDARLLTFHGITHLAQQVRSRSHIGVCSASIQGIVGNQRQITSQSNQFRLEPRMLAFVCVYIPKSVYDKIGLLDERLVGYGFEDNDYCTRILKSGLQLGIWDGCVVDHSNKSASTFRTKPNICKLYKQNYHLFKKKWGPFSLSKRYV